MIRKIEKLNVRRRKMIEDKRIKCIFCKKPIHIDNWAGVNKEGYFCNNVVCLMQLAKKEVQKEATKKLELYCKNPACFNHYLAKHKIKEVRKVKGEGNK